MTLKTDIDQQTCPYCGGRPCTIMLRNHQGYGCGTADCGSGFWIVARSENRIDVAVVAWHAAARAVREYRKAALAPKRPPKTV